MSPEEDAAEQQPRCQISEMLIAESKCRRLGEVRLDGGLLCVRHAEVLRLEDRSEIMLGMVFEMDQWLDSVDGEADQVRVRHVEQQRNEIVEQLRFNRARIGVIRDELLKDQISEAGDGEQRPGDSLDRPFE